MSANALSLRIAWSNIRALSRELKKPIWFLLLAYCAVYTVLTVQYADVIQKHQQPTVAFWVWMSVLVLLGAAMGYAVNRAIAAHERGEPPSVGFLLDGFFMRFLVPMIVLFFGAGVVMGFILLPAFFVILPFLWVSLPAIASFVTLIMVLCLALLCLLLRLTCLLPVVAFDDISMFGALDRSWPMTSGRFWAVFRVWLGTIVLIIVATCVWALLLGLFGLPLPSAETAPKPTALFYIYTFGAAILTFIPPVLMPAAIYRVLRDSPSAEQA